MNKKKYAVLTMIVVGIFDLIMLIITLVNRNSGKISEKTVTLDSSLKIIVLALLVVFTPIYFVIKHIFETKKNSCILITLVKRLFILKTISLLEIIMSMVLYLI